MRAKSMLLREMSNASATSNTVANTGASQRARAANRSSLDLWRPKDIAKGMINSSSRLGSSSVM